MDADGSRTNSTLGSNVSDGSSKYAHSSPTLHTRIKSYNDISSNSVGKMDSTTSRPCAIIGPDRVLPSNSGDIYLKKAVEAWPCQENVYRHTTDFQSKMPEYQPNRNISPRQTFQENMQRILVPPTYSSIKIPEESSSKNTKLNMPHEAKYCDVPYNNSVNNELKSVRNPDIPMTNINPAFGRSVPPYGWPHGVNMRPLRPYGAPDFYQYSDYPSCAGPRPMQMVRQHQALNGDTSQMYPDHLYQESNIRFKPYPLAKERQQQVRYDYISNYPNTFHPPNPFPSHRYDVQKSIHGHPYPVYPQIPIKYLDRRIHEPITDSYQRSPNTPNFNMAYRNQPVAPPYGPLSGNCVQAKPYPPDGSIKPNNKLPFDSSSKVYADLEPKHNKGYPTSDNLYLNEINHHQSLRGDILLPPHSLNMHTVPQHAMYRKDNTYPKNFEYNIQYRNFDQTMNNSLPRFPFQYSPNTLAISPSDSNTSNDTAHTLGTPQEDCGYVSQSSTTSVRSLDSYNIQATNDALRRHNFNTYGLHRNNGKEMIAKRKSSSSDKKNINVRQFLQMWNEGDDDVSEPNKETVTSNNTVKNDDEPLYVLGLVNVPSNEIGKYEHIQKISKLPENIKGYNSLELLNQYEELLEPSNSDKYASNQLMTRQCNPSLRNRINKEHVTVPRPVSPLDVEAKISQSVIHKEVGCNFEIKPCSPEMLNVEIATPVQNILGERTIEKVINPVITHSPLLQHVENNIQNSNVIKNSSCKMLNHPFTPEPSSGNIKANNMYNNAQDLETNSGVCLASLPQLDNDLELNFPEINQQFINANKKGSNTQLSSKSLNLIDADQKHTVLNEKSGHQQINLLSPHTPSSTEKEVSKLSKYRKNKKVEPTAPSPNDFTKTIILPVTTQRIDSVIIKNPDNIKLQDFQSSTAYGLNTLLEDSNQNFNNNLSLEKAIDFSLNKIEVEIPMDNILNNINHTEDHIIEDHCNAITTCNDVNEDVEKNKHDSTLKQDYDTENKINQTVPLENIPRSSEIEKDIFNTRQNEHNKNLSKSETLPCGIDTLQDNSLMKMTQNSGIEDHHKPITTSDNISQNCQIKQENFSFNLQQENKKTDHVNIAENILSSYENDSKNVTIKQDEFSNICQFPSSTGNSSCGDILSHNSKDISEGQNLNNSIDVVNKNDTLKIEPSVLSVIHARTTSEEVSLFSDTHSNTNKNKSVINKSEIEISEITTQKVSEAKRNFPEISLPVLENFPNKGSELFDTTLKDSVMKNMEQFTLPHADEITIMCNENICNQTKEIANSSFQQNDDESKLVNNLPDTNLSKTSTGFDEILHDNAVLHTEKTYDESENNPNSFSNIKSFKPIEQNFENENKDFYNNVASVDSEIKYDECLTNKIELNDTSEEKGLDTAVLENFDPEKLLETVQFYKGESQSAIEKQNENLESDSKDISSTNKIDTSVINEISIEATKIVILNEVSDSCKENQSQNNLDTLKISLAQSEHILVNDNINVDLNLNEVCNRSSFELNKIKNIITDAEMIGDERNISNNLKNVSKLNDETQDKQSFCKRNIKIHKNLFSPWIQKLIMHTEGINVIENKLSNDKRSNESVDELQFTSNSFEKDDIEIKDLKNPLNIFNGTDISVNANDSQENTIDTSDTTLVLILSTDNQKNDLRTVDEIKNCVAITPNEASRQKFEESLDREVTVETKVSKKSQFFGNRPQKLLKRSLSESAIDNRNNDGPNLLIPTKRRKENNVLQSHITAEDLCNIVQSNRRNSVSTFYNEDSVYILIDNDLIITEQSDDSDKTCYTDTDVCNANEECESVFEKTDKNMSDFVPSESFENDDHLNELRSTDEKTAEESWVEDVACIETVFSDDVAEDITIDETKSPNITSEEFFENDDLNIYEEMSESTLIDKVRNIYGSSVSNENIQFLETMYRTPQMNVSRTLVDKESHNLETLQTHVQDNESHKLETVYLSHHNSLIDDKENLSNDSMLESKTLKTYSDEKENSVNVLLSNDSLNECIVHSCETTKEHFTSDIQKDNSHYSYSSSPEVSSTTSEEKGILLKITNYNGSRSSQINDITDDINKISYKLTENKEYRSYKSNFSSTRTLITKAAQKYIPPLKESIGDLKVKLPLPQHHLNKLKQLKKSKVEPKITENIIRYTNRNIKADIPKKVKPKFEDVLKSIDEIQFKQRKDKVKRGKSQIPKVVIKKSENGAHYTSSNALNNEVYNPDLTGRKWQPWVFMEKNNFIDRMAIKKKYKAVYCHRKKTYVLAEKFRKYKSVYNAKFVITQPKSGNTTNGNLKYTIRLQHK